MTPFRPQLTVNGTAYYLPRDTVTCNDSCVVPKHGIMYSREKKTCANSCLGLRVALRTQHNTNFGRSGRTVTSFFSRTHNGASYQHFTLGGIALSAPRSKRSCPKRTKRHRDRRWTPQGIGRKGTLLDVVLVSHEMGGRELQLSLEASPRRSQLGVKSLALCPLSNRPREKRDENGKHPTAAAASRASLTRLPVP